MTSRIINNQNNNLLMGTAIYKKVEFSKGIEAEFKCINVDIAFGKILGISEDKVYKVDLLTFLSDFDATIVEFYKEFISRGEDIATEFYFYSSDKKIKINFIKVNKEYIVTQLLDFKLHSSSTKNASQYETLLNNSTDIILTIKDSREIMDCNEQSVKVYGYTRDELLKLSIDDISANTRNINDEELYTTVKDGLIIEDSHYRKDGTVFPVEVRAIGIEAEGEKFIFSIARDITERKNFIDDLNKKNKELENALDRLKQTQIQLMNEDKMASIGQLSAGIAHEINNPLGFVLSNFNTLKKYIGKFSNTIEAYRNLITKIGDNNVMISQELNEIDKKNKIDYILEDLEGLFSDTEEGLNRIRKIVLALRKFAHDNVTGEFEEYDLNDGINNTLIIVKNEIKYNCDIKTNLGEIPMINVIGSEINQVLLNMIINASHAIKDKIDKSNIRGEIIITTYCDNDFVCFSIEDNGSGISKENLNRIFEPFFTTKPVGIGTGLGLSISYEIIKNKHKGEIEINSTVGLGTKITIKLPKSLG